MTVLVIIGCVVLVLAVALDAWAAVGAPGVSTPPVSTGVARVNDDPVGSRRCADEAALVAALLDGTLDPAEYHLAMAALAAEDVVRRPVVVPPDAHT